MKFYVSTACNLQHVWSCEHISALYWIGSNGQQTRYTCVWAKPLCHLAYDKYTSAASAQMLHVWSLPYKPVWISCGFLESFRQAAGLTRCTRTMVVEGLIARVSRLNLHDINQFLLESRRITPLRKCHMWSVILSSLWSHHTWPRQIKICFIIDSP